MLIEGGLLAAVLVLIFLLWMLVRTWSLWSRRIGSTDQLLGSAGSIIVLLILVSSAVDYPLRTPILSVLITTVCVWMLGPERPAKNAVER